jgi:hypothetical protein
MMQARTLARSTRVRRGDRGTLGLEACLVSPTIDLGSGDLVSDTLAGGVLDFLRGASAARPAKAQKLKLAANCGAAARLPNASGAPERVWLALGAAAGLKAEAARPNGGAMAADSTENQLGVVVFYALPGELRAALWQKAMTFSAERQLPVLFVVLPPAQGKGGAARSPKSGDLSALALRSGVAGIPVDADDAVAIYRVAQESIGHARIGGGPALMECVPFAIAGAAARRGPVTNAIAILEQYMLQRGVATRAWMERESKAFIRRMATRAAASR